MDETQMDEKKKWMEKLDGAKSKIGRNFQPNTFDFDPASNAARGAIILPRNGPPPERRQTPQIERGGDAQMKWIRIPAASPPCFGRQAGQWQALITPPTSEDRLVR